MILFSKESSVKYPTKLALSSIILLKGSFEVGILSDNIEGLMYDITQKFMVRQTNFKSLNNELKLEIQLGNAAPNELLNILVQRGQVTHFVEKIPSVTDIFMQTVSQ